MDKHAEMLNALLQEKFDIEVEDYFKLTEDDRNELSDILFNFYQNNINKDPALTYFYIKVVTDLRNKSISNEEYESADILNRVKEKLMQLI